MLRMAKLLLINGPNINLLGTREPSLYGSQNLTNIEKNLTEQAKQLGHTLHTVQHNSEGALVDSVQQAQQDQIDFILINPAAYTHTSIALRDALLAVNIPFIEIHLSNIYQREAFRQQSYLADIALGGIFGLGVAGYQLALQAADEYLQQKMNKEN